jgi:hypothetical protein
MIADQYQLYSIHDPDHFHSMEEYGTDWAENCLHDLIMWLTVNRPTRQAITKKNDEIERLRAHLANLEKDE